MSFWKGLGAVSVAAACSLGAACDRSSSSPSSVLSPPAGIPLADGGTFQRSQVLAGVGQCLVKDMALFEDQARRLVQASELLERGPDANTLQDARSAWLEAMDTWQRLEALTLGPAAAADTPGGKEYRYAINAWPLGNRCLVEQTLVSQGFRNAGFSTSLISTRSMTALEYLLFYPGKDNACGTSALINAQGAWAALSEDELRVRKAAYAAVVARDVLAVAKTLHDSWKPEGGGFRRELETAGNGSRVYRSEQMALNAISDAFFYLDTELKDRKVARPAGYAQCDKPTCLEALESPYAGASKRHVRNNLEGFRRFFHGCGEGAEGVSLDDLLGALGAGDLSTRISQATDRAMAALDTLPEGDFSDALAQRPETMRAFYDRLRELVTLLRTEFVSILDLELPKRLEGDND